MPGRGGWKTLLLRMREGSQLLSPFLPHDHAHHVISPLLTKITLNKCLENDTKTLRSAYKNNIGHFMTATFFWINQSCWDNAIHRHGIKKGRALYLSLGLFENCHCRDYTTSDKVMMTKTKIYREYTHLKGFLLKKHSTNQQVLIKLP